MSVLDDIKAGAEQLKSLLGQLGLPELQEVAGIVIDLEQAIADAIAAKGFDAKVAVDAADTAADALEEKKFGGKP